LSYEPWYLAHQAAFGALAAVGFGVLFNFGWRGMPWVAITGATALAVRTLGLDAGWSLEAATFVAAAATGVVVRILRIRLGMQSNALAVAGCIPMVPGAFAAQTIFGLFALTSPHSADRSAEATTVVEFLLRVSFTVGAIGAGLAIVGHILKSDDF
jgi:uncharacterized membrane protein YjjB (DUF3815 family)